MYTYSKSQSATTLQVYHHPHILFGVPCLGQYRIFRRVDNMRLRNIKVVGTAERLNWRTLHIIVKRRIPDDHISANLHDDCLPMDVRNRNRVAIFHLRACSDGQKITRTSWVQSNDPSVVHRAHRTREQSCPCSPKPYLVP